MESSFTTTARRKLGLKEKEIAFGVVGGFDLPVGKGQRVFLRAAKEVMTRLPQARFFLAGRGSMESALLEDIQHLGLEDRARLIGQQDDPVSLYHALDILVHPQIATEAFPSVVLEAHACGRPVIASELDGIPEAWKIGGVGQLVSAGDPYLLARAMIQQAEHPAPTQAETAEMHRRVETEASLPVQAKKVEDLYRRLMAR